MCTRKITGSVLHGRLFRFQYENTCIMMSVVMWEEVL